MEELIKYAIENGASDIHITEGNKSWVRIKNELMPYGERLTFSVIDEFVKEHMVSIYERFGHMSEGLNTEPIDGAFKFLGTRIRVNIYLGSDGLNLALRLLSNEILPLDKLCLPESIKKFTQIKSGLFIVVGTTGSGKSTTLASMIDEINHTRSENILTIEQPIEYMYKPDKCRIEQMEVGLHIESFAMATVAAMRQDPNILLIGEMRDLETIQNAITLAETGHVVYGTLHAKSVTDTIDRIIDVFPSKQQEQVRFQLANVLKGVLHQTLVRGAKGVVPLVELLAVDDVTASMIMGKQKSNSIRDRLRGNSAFGCVHIVDNAAWHIKNGRLTIEDVKPYLSTDDYNIVNAVAGMGRRF